MAAPSGRSWSELSSMASLTCFSCQEIKAAGDSLQEGWKVGLTLETRCYLSLEHQGTKHPITYLTSSPRVRAGQRESGPVKGHLVSFKPHLGLSRMPE